MKKLAIVLATLMFAVTLNAQWEIDKNEPHLYRDESNNVYNTITKEIYFKVYMQEQYKQILCRTFKRDNVKTRTGWTSSRLIAKTKDGKDIVREGRALVVYSLSDDEKTVYITTEMITDDFFFGLDTFLVTFYEPLLKQFCTVSTNVKELRELLKQ